MFVRNMFSIFILLYYPMITFILTIKKHQVDFKGIATPSCQPLSCPALLRVAGFGAGSFKNISSAASRTYE